MDKKIIIEPIFITLTASDTHNANGTLGHPKGSAIAYMSSFKTKRFGEFSVITPNPAHLFIATANHALSEIDNEIKSINSINKIIVFSKMLDGVEKYTTEELLRLDPTAKQIRNLDRNKIYKYIWLTLSFLTSLLGAVESFVNKEIPVDYRHKKVKEIEKKEIELSFRLEDKINILADILGKTDYKQKDFWQGFKNTKKLRDGLIHLKTNGSDKVNRHDELFQKIMDFNFYGSRNDVVALLNYLKPNYIKEQLC